MEEQKPLPDVFHQIQRSLDPYTKRTRQETAQIRRVLAVQLNSSLNPDGRALPRPLSLVDTSSSVETIPHGVRGLRKEYLRCVRANVNARREYIQNCETQKPKGVDQDGAALRNDAIGDPVETFLSLIKQQQKHEVLCVVQDHIDMLSQKPAALPEFLDPKEVLKGVKSLPQVPPDVLNPAASQQRSGGLNLKDLVDQLEKSILRAKLLLKREQKLLAKVRSEQGCPHVNEANKLHALGTTRNELINWIEIELSRAGESSPEAEDLDAPASPEKKRRPESIDSQLASIQHQYSRYTGARKRLVLAATGNLAALPGAPIADETDLSVTSLEPVDIPAMSHVTYPFLEELVAISNEQKAIIQQKSHLTINLGKQLKESSQSLERLAHESHLLPSHPMPTKSTLRKGPESSISFGDEMSKHEKPDSSRGARAWVYASESATNLTKEAILDKLEEGSVAIDESRQIMLELQRLLGYDFKTTSGGDDGDSSTRREAANASDIWSVLDGSLGVIAQDSGIIM